MVGGIVANNASGMCCGVAQNSYHTLMEVRAVFANGQVLDTSDSGSVEQFRASMFGDRLLAGLAQLRDEILGDSEMSARIRKKFEIKCTCARHCCLPAHLR
jgi:D-lactate dehydrogenase